MLGVFLLIALVACLYGLVEQQARFNREMRERYDPYYRYSPLSPLAATLFVGVVLVVWLVLVN